MKKFIIDVSTYQKEIDWDKMKAQGVEGAILRIGYTGWGTGKTKSKDYRFERNYAECQRLGIDTGVYWYSCAVTQAEAIEEANKTLSYLNNRPLQFPIFFDTEDNHDLSKGSPTSQFSVAKEKGKQFLTDIAKSFCETIKKTKYDVGVYASKYWFIDQLVYNDLPYYIWVAQYNDTCTFNEKYDIWQFSSKYFLEGIPTEHGYVDANYLYTDFTNNQETEIEETMLLKCIKTSIPKGYPYRASAGKKVMGYFKVGDVIKVTNIYSKGIVSKYIKGDIWMDTSDGYTFLYDKNNFA